MTRRSAMLICQEIRCVEVWLQVSKLTSRPARPQPTQRALPYEGSALFKSLKLRLQRRWYPVLGTSSPMRLHMQRQSQRKTLPELLTSSALQGRRQAFASSCKVMHHLGAAGLLLGLQLVSGCYHFGFPIAGKPKRLQAIWHCGPQLMT